MRFGDRQIDRDERDARAALVSPGGGAIEIRNLNDERGRVTTRSCLLQWQQQRSIRTATRPDRTTSDRRTPEHGSRRYVELEKVSLVVPHGKTRLDQHLAVRSNQCVVFSFFDVGCEHGLWRITRDVE